MRHWLLAYLIVFVAFLGPVGAQDIILDTSLWNEITSNYLTSVEVTGALRGSGVIVTLNGKPAVITNSHNLQGAKTARIRTPEVLIRYYDLSNTVSGRRDVQTTLNINGEYPVLIDDPLHDFAFISLEANSSSENDKLLKTLGALSGNFCYQQNCGKYTWVPSDRFRTFETSLAVVLNGKREKISLLRGLAPTLVDDHMISGEQRKILSLPFYSRPGVSGGGFYDRGILKGLITKVSLIGTPETYATLMDDIGKYINAPINDKITAEWVKGELHVTVDGEEFILKSSSNGGGETGHGGGETGHGGGETGHGGGETGHGGGGPNANFWTLDFPQLIGGSRVMTTWNPFVRRGSSFLLNGEEIAFFEVDGKFQLPGLATYRWNKLKRKKQKKFLHTEANIELLEQARHKVFDGSMCGRVYNLNATKGIYVSERGLQTTAADDSTLFVLTDTDGKLPRTRDFSGGGPAKIIDVPGNWIDPDGWVRSWFTASRRTPGLVLDFMRTKLSMPFTREGPKGLFHVTAGLDLDKVSFTQGSESIVLERLESKSVSAILFASKDGTHKAAFLYDVSDLKELERIYIQTPTGLSEIGPCKNFAGVR